jgi:hypothetical protein
MNYAQPKLLDILIVGTVEAGHHILENFGQPQSPRDALLMVDGSNPSHPLEHVGPVASFAQERDRRKATAKPNRVAKVLLHSPEEYNGGRSLVMWCRGREFWKEGSGDVGIREALLHHTSQLLRDDAYVEGVDSVGAGIDLDLDPTFMGNKNRAESLGISVDEEAELGEDGEPNVVRPDLQVQVLLPGANNGVGEAVLVGYEGAETVVWDAEM